MNKKYIKYNYFIKRKLNNRFTYSKTTKILKNIVFSLSRILLFILKYIAIIVRPFLKEIKPEECDILVYPNSKSHLERSKETWQMLENKNYKVLFFLADKNYLLKYVFKYKINFDKKVSYQIFFHHAFAKYITQKFKFKIICDYHNFEITSALIKKELNKNQKNIFIPHGKIRNSYRHSCFTFDYYLVFGNSSIEKIKENKLRLGNTKLVKTGSVFIPNNFNLPICLNFKNVLFFSNWAVSYHPESKRGFEIVVNWAKNNPDYNLFIRLHPLEDGKYVEEKTKDIKNIFVQNKSLSLKQSLENVSITIASASNASIESALLNRPSLVALDVKYNKNSKNVYESDNNFYLESYFPERARNAEQLHQRIEQVTKDYNFYLQQCKNYVKYHLEYTNNARKQTSQIIEKIYLNKIDFEYTEILENFDL